VNDTASLCSYVPRLIKGESGFRKPKCSFVEDVVDREKLVSFKGSMKDAKLSLVRRPFELLANDLGFGIELQVDIRAVVTFKLVIIILDEATFKFIRRFKCFHLKELVIFNKCYVEIVAYMDMNAAVLKDGRRPLAPKARCARAESVVK
jgi:hypothetical protein